MDNHWTQISNITSYKRSSSKKTKYLLYQIGKCDELPYPGSYPVDNYPPDNYHPDNYPLGTITPRTITLLGSALVTLFKVLKRAGKIVNFFKL